MAKSVLIPTLSWISPISARPLVCTLTAAPLHPRLYIYYLECRLSSGPKAARVVSFDLTSIGVSMSQDLQEVPCSSEGLVDLDLLSEKARTSYFAARVQLGSEYGRPVVEALLRH